jgi:hypothetical protein
VSLTVMVLFLKSITADASARNVRPRMTDSVRFSQM